MRRPSSRIFWISVLVLLALSPAGAASAQAARLAPRAHPRLLTALENGSDDLSVIVALKEVTKYAPATESASPGDADREARTRRLAAQWRLAAQMSGSDFQATLDTGVDFTVSELGGAAFPNDKVVGGTNTGDQTSDPQDCEGHGTSVAAIIAGTAGVAPDAKIVAVKVFPECFPFASDSAILAGIDFAIENRSRFSIGAINMSLGAPASDGSDVGFCDSQEPQFATAIDAATAAGMVVLVSSGNEGTSTALSSPACISSAVSVGAVYSTQIGNVDWGICVDDQIQPDQPTCFSNSNENLTLLAPGAFWSVVTVGGDLNSFTGTSAAAPAAAGTVALLKEARPTLTPSAIVGLLEATGRPVRTPSSGVLTPRVDAFAAVQLASAASFSFSGGAVEIPDGSGSAEVSVTVSGFTGPLGSVQAWVQIDHGDPTQLRVTLAGPDGTSAVLHDHTGAPQHPINTTFGLTGASATALLVFEGKLANGVWTLTVEDTVSGVSGRIRNFALSLVPGQPHVAVPALTDGFVIPAVSRSDIDQLSSDDLRLYNPGAVPKTLEIFFVPKGQTGELAVRSTRTVGAGQVLALNDVLFSEFGYTQASGQLTIISDDTNFFATSRSFTDSLAGFYGSLQPGQQVSSATAPGAGAATLPALTRQTFAHSDVGFTEVSGAPATVLFAVKDTDGFPLGSTQQTALPNQTAHLADPIRYLGLALTPEYRVDALVVSGTGRVLPFATTTDDLTGDTTFEAAVPAAPASSDDWIVPYAVSDSSGVDQTDLTIVNVGTAPIDVTVSVTPPVIPDIVFPSGPRTYAVGPGEMLTRANILLEDFDFSAPLPASLRIHTDSPSRLVVAARRARVLGSGSYALIEQAVPAASALAAGLTATAIHMDQNSETLSAFGFVEVSGNDAVVRVSVVDGSNGVELGAKDYPVSAGNEVFAGAEDILGTATASNIYFRFSVSSGEGHVVAYGLATDIRSGDAILVLARKDPPAAPQPGP